MKRRIAHDWLCISCNYPLRGLAEPRCPECGRAFDPDNLDSINASGRPVPLWVRRWLVPPLWPINLAAVGILAMACWMARGPQSSTAIALLAPTSLILAAWMGMGLLRWVLLAIYAPLAELCRDRSGRWTLAPALLLAAWIVPAVGLSFRARFWLSRPFMAHSAQALLDGPPQYSYSDRWLGLFEAKEISTTLEEVHFQFDDGSRHAYGLIYAPAGGVRPRAGLGVQRIISLGGGWYLDSAPAPKASDDRAELLENLATAPLPRLQSALPLLIRSLRDSAVTPLRIPFKSVGWGFRAEQRPDESQWVPRQDAFGVGQELRPDLQGLMRLNSAAWPSLRAALRDADPSVRWRACAAIGLMDPPLPAAQDELVRLLGDPEPYVRELAACALARLGPVAQRAVPALWLMVGDPDAAIAYNAAVALRRIHPENEPFGQTLAAAIAQSATAPATPPSTRPATKLRAVEARSASQDLVTRVALLCELLDLAGEDARAAAPCLAVLIQACRDPNHWLSGLGGAGNADLALAIQRHALASLRRLGPAARPALGGLLDDFVAQLPNVRLSDDNARREFETLTDLILQIDPHDQRAPEALAREILAVRTTTRSAVWRYSREMERIRLIFHADLLRRFSPLPADMVSTLQYDAQHANSPAQREFAVRILIELNVQPRQLIGMFQPMLSSPARSERRVALAGLTQLKEGAAEATPELMRIVEADGSAPRDPDVPELPDLALEAARALGAIGPAAAPATPALLKLLKNAPRDQRDVIVEQLGRLGPGAASAVPALTALLKDSDPWLVRPAADALGQIGADAAPAAPALCELIRHDGENTDVAATAEAAATALGKIGRAAPQIVPQIVTELSGHLPAHSIVCVIRMYGQIGPAAEDAVGFLMEQVRQPQSDATVQAAILALGQIGTNVLPALLWNVHNASPRTQEIAIDNLCAMGAPADRTAPFLMRVLSEDQSSAQGRLKAARALASYGIAAYSAKPLLEKCRYSDPDEEVRRACADAIRAIAGEWK